MKLDSIENVQLGLSRQGYIAERPLATAVYLALSLKKPLFVEGEPGTGKTELALVLTGLLNSRLIRLQCYEGLDAHSALYEWNYPKQLLTIRMMESEGRGASQMAPEIFTTDFLIERPLLKALRLSELQTPVLLIDELDRADEEFEAFLLEFLDGFQISIPEIGTVKAKNPPMVILTSNRTRDVHEALKRRCLYHWIELPDLAKELAIVRAKLPQLEESLAAQVAGFMQRIRQGDFLKAPGVSETLDWARALLTLGAHKLDAETVEATLGCIFKYQDDLAQFRNTLWSTEDARAGLLAGCGA